MMIQFDPDLAVTAQFLTLNLALSIGELLLVFALAARWLARAHKQALLHPKWVLLPIPNSGADKLNGVGELLLPMPRMKFG